MATVPVVRTWTAGEVVTAAFMNLNIRDVCAWLLSPAICQVRQIVSQSLATGTPAAITMTAEDSDTTGMHSTVSNTSRLTAVYPGVYDTVGCVGYAANATGRRIPSIRVNAAVVDGAATAFSATAASVGKFPTPRMQTFLNVGDYLELWGTQESGGALSTAVGGANDQSILSTRWVSN